MFRFFFSVSPFFFFLSGYDIFPCTFCRYFDVVEFFPPISLNLFRSIFRICLVNLVLDLGGNLQLLCRR